MRRRVAILLAWAAGGCMGADEVPLQTGSYRVSLTSRGYFFGYPAFVDVDEAGGVRGHGFDDAHLCDGSLDTATHGALTDALNDVRALSQTGSPTDDCDDQTVWTIRITVTAGEGAGRFNEFEFDACPDRIPALERVPEILLDAVASLDAALCAACPVELGAGDCYEPDFGAVEFCTDAGVQRCDATAQDQVVECVRDRAVRCDDGRWVPATTWQLQDPILYRYTEENVQRVVLVGDLHFEYPDETFGFVEFLD